MPHIKNFSFKGARLRSVSTITNTLAKDGIIRWQRALGFEESDRQSAEARILGSRAAKMFELYRKRNRQPRSNYLKTILDEWLKWGEGWGGIQLVPEPHLVNTIEGYHGSPDLIFYTGGKWNLGDDKVKKRFADYGLLMNEHAYAMCDKIHNTKTGELSNVPWEIPIKDIWFWTYHPVTGKLYPHHHEFEPDVYADFLRCRDMAKVNAIAGKYFTSFAVKLPEARNETTD